MDMRDLAQLIAPATSDNIRQIKGHPVRGALGLPFSVLSDAVRAPFAVADTAVGAVTHPLRQSPALGGLIKAAHRGALAATTPLGPQRADLLGAQTNRMNAEAKLIPAEGRFLDARAGLAGAQARFTNNQANVLGGIVGGGMGGPPVPGQPPAAGNAGRSDPMEITDNLIAQLAAAGLTSEATALLSVRDSARERDQELYERGQYGRDWTPDQLDDQFQQRTKEFEFYAEIDDTRRQVESTGNTGLGIPTLINLLQRQIDPGMGVRDSDVRQITKGALSGVDLTVKDFLNWFKANAGADLVVPKLKEVVGKLVDAKEDAFAQKFEDAIESGRRRDMTEEGLERALPYWEQGHRAIENRDRRRSATPSPHDGDETVAGDVPLSAHPEAMVRSVMDIVEAEMPGMSDSAVTIEVLRRLQEGG